MVFRWLAVFVGGFRLPAAEAVVRSMREVAGPSPSQPDLVIDSIDTLIASSLLHRVPGPSQDYRYAMLEVVREFGLELLAASGELATVQSAHIQHYSSIREWLDPNRFRAQLQSESNAFKQDFRKSMQAEGDLDRASENNTSIGLGQISRKFLDGREWSDGGPGNARVGSQVVSTEQYLNSPTVQLRMAASNLTQRIADHGGLEQGLAYYVSGNADPSNSHAAQYLANIEQAMNDPAVIGPGR
jgi:hypothetical protein